MFVYSKKQKMWINLSLVLRIGQDGTGNYLVVFQDGSKATLDKEEYEKAMRYVDPDYWETHTHEGFNIEKTLKAIMKATGAKEEKKEEDD